MVLLARTARCAGFFQDSSEINHGRLYPNLNELAEMGLVEKGSADDRTNSYGLTERGHREIEARREWEDQYVAVEA